MASLTLVTRRLVATAKTESLGREAQIGRIEHELENLVDSYGVLENNVWWLKTSFKAFVVALLGLAGFGAIVGNPKLFVASTVILAFAGLAALIGPRRRTFA